MTLSIAELAQARETAAGLLDELGLAAYLFDLEPAGEQWELKVDCAMAADGAWETVTLRVPKETLLASPDDAMRRRRILGDLHDRLVACRTQK